MNNLSKYLQKFKLIIGDKTEEKRIIQYVIKTNLNLDVSLEQIRIEGAVATLNVRPLERGELMIHKKNILESFSKKGLFITELH